MTMLIFFHFDHSLSWSSFCRHNVEAFWVKLSARLQQEGLSLKLSEIHLHAFKEMISTNDSKVSSKKASTRKFSITSSCGRTDSSSPEDPNQIKCRLTNRRLNRQTERLFFCRKLSTEKFSMALLPWSAMVYWPTRKRRPLSLACSSLCLTLFDKRVGRT